MDALIECCGVFYATTAQAAQQLRDAGAKVTDQRIRDWARRGLIEPVVRLEDGRPVYRMDDVWDAERDTRLAATRRGGACRLTRAG